MDKGILKKQIASIFKLNGLTVRSDGIKHMCDLLEPITQNEYEQWIERVIEAIQKLPLSTTLINLEVIQKAVEDVSSAESDDLEVLLQVIDIYKVPKWIYNVERKKFLISASHKTSLHGEPDDKTNLFRNRYVIVHQRTLNHELFRTSVSSLGTNNSKQLGIVKIEYLLGLSSKKNDVIVLGLLSQLVEGAFHLEDDTGFVKVDLTETKFHNGLFTQNCFLLVEGWFEDEILHANAVGLPPAETADTTRALLGNINYFGGQGNVCQKFSKQLLNAERENSEAMIVFISDLWLDKIQVMDRLHLLFRGYALFPPTAFVFCGNFLSATHGSHQYSDLQSAFSSLGDIITSYPELQSKSRFIFVPGPNDPGPGNIFPRPPLPPLITEEFRKKVPNSDFTSNPCRLLYCTQEIVIFREDIYTKMCRNAVYFPADISNITSHFARTIISEAHLSPLPLHTVPIYWGLDHCLSLHPTPDLIVIADKGDSFTESFNSCIVMNPGSFMKTDFSFKVFMASSKEVEDSQIGDS